MELNKNLEYRICFDKVENLDEIKKNENYVGSVNYESSTYAITIDDLSKEKELAKDLAYSFLPKFKDLFYTCLNESGKPIKHLEFFEKETFEMILEK